MLKFGDANISPVKPAIYFKRAGASGGVTVKKDHFTVSFFLPEKTEEFPTEKSVQYAKKKYAHTVSAADVGDVTTQLVKWLRVSYFLAKS